MASANAVPLSVASGGHFLQGHPISDFSAPEFFWRVSLLPAQVLLSGPHVVQAHCLTHPRPRAFTALLGTPFAFLRFRVAVSWVLCLAFLGLLPCVVGAYPPVGFVQ